MGMRLNKAASLYQQNMADMQKGAQEAGSLVAPAAPVPAAPEPTAHGAAAPTPEDTEYSQLGDAVAKQQAANAGNPSLQDKLNMVAKARAKFYGGSQ